MVTIPPNVVGLIFANRLLIDKEKGDVSLIGIFQEKNFSSFPSDPVEMVVFVIVNGGRGEGFFELTVYQLDRHGDHEAEDWIYRKRKWYKFPDDDPNRILNVEIPIKSLRFPDVGEYLFSLTLDGKPVTERRMFIHMVK
jgi:hypothetical protein